MTHILCWQQCMSDRVTAGSSNTCPYTCLVQCQVLMHASPWARCPVLLGCMKSQQTTDRQDLVWLKLWIGYVWLDLLDDGNRDVVLVKGPQALQEVCLHQHLLASLRYTLP